MENQIARDLTNQPNFHARVKLLTGEHTIKTKALPPILTGNQLTQRIEQIQAQTRQNYCKPRAAVEEEMRERQETLRSRSNETTTNNPNRGKGRGTDTPPPTYYSTFAVNLK